MCKWKIFIGLFKKKSPNMEFNSVQSDIFLQSPQQFHDEFQRQLTEDNVRELSVIFRMMDISSQVISKSLFKFMNKGRFREIFKAELKKYDSNWKKPERMGRRALSNALRKHCFAVLSTYLDMVEYMHDPMVLDNFLEQIAISHCFITNPKVSFKLHDLILREFIKMEFGKYITRKTRTALTKYLNLISTRLRVLMEQQSKGNDFAGTSQAMERQRSIIKTRIDKLGIFNEVYVNETRSCSSEFSLIPSEAVYPGTSRGRRVSLDRRSK